MKLGLKLVRLIAISLSMERERRSQIVKTEGWEERAEIGMVLVHEGENNSLCLTGVRA